MRRIILAVVLLFTAIAHADEPVQLKLKLPPAKRRLDAGASVAIAGVSLLAVTWSITAMSAFSIDLNCGLSSGLGENYQTCPSHTSLMIPFAGGILNAMENHDSSRGIGIASSVIQIASFGMIVGGLVAHSWPRRELGVTVTPYVGPGSAGVVGRF